MELESIDEQRLRIGSTVLTTSEVEQLIRDLALLRGDMQPAVSRALDAADDVDVVGDPQMQIGLTTDRRVVLVLRHEGFGWCGFEFSPEQAATLRNALQRHTTDVAGQIPLDAATPTGDAPIQ